MSETEWEFVPQDRVLDRNKPQVRRKVVAGQEFILKPRRDSVYELSTFDGRFRKEVGLTELCPLTGDIINMSMILAAADRHIEEYLDAR